MLPLHPWLEQRGRGGGVRQATRRGYHAGRLLLSGNYDDFGDSDDDDDADDDGGGGGGVRQTTR